MYKKYKNILCMMMLAALLLTQFTVSVFANELPVGGEQYILDFNATDATADGVTAYNTKATDKNYNNATVLSHSISIEEVDGIKVLQHTVPEGTANNAMTVLKIPLGSEATEITGGGTYSIIIKAKLPPASTNQMFRGFGSLGYGNQIYINGLTQTTLGKDYMLTADDHLDGLWMYKQNTSDNKTWKSGSSLNHIAVSADTDAMKITLADSSQDFYLYKWTIDSANESFRFYYSKDDGVTWIEPYDSYNMMQSKDYIGYGVEKRYEDKGVMPTGKNLPAKIDSILVRTRAGKDSKNFTYNIASIKIEKATAPNIDTTSIDGRTDYVEPDENIGLNFNIEIDESSVSYSSVKLLEKVDGEYTEVSEGDYSVALSDDKKSMTVSMVDGFNPKTDYRLSVNGLVAETQLKGKMTDTKNLDFHILGEYETKNVDVSVNGENIDLKFDFVNYLKKTDGCGYVLVGALIKKDTNTFYGIDLESGSSTYTDVAYEDIHVTLSFAKPDGFDADDYEVRLYVWDSLVNSKSILKPVSYSID